MKSEALVAGIVFSPGQVRKRLRDHGWCWRTGGAALGLCLGIVAPLIGSLLTVAAWFVGAQLHAVLIQRLGTVLLFLTIPLLILGAHCLDLMDQHDEAARRQKAEIVKLTGRK